MDEQFLERMDCALAGWTDPAARLHQALRNNELQLFCQPILALEGAERYPLGEVLVRMLEEERALLPPGEFLPAFEHFGMMPQLDRWVVFHAAQRLARGTTLPRLCVNVSGQTLEDGAFHAYVRAALQR
ncbi:MAG TPA: EAL domain-containing protein, partial [Burkholderiales bacterium]|nr:EAL domain-containing protein [Burkholderiales bacterium]